MAKKGQVQITVDIKTAKAVSSIKKMVQTNNQMMSRLVQDTAKGASGFKLFGKDVVAVNQLLELAGKAWGALNKVIGTAIGLMQDAGKERSSIRQLGFAFRAIGQPVDESVQAIQDFADAQQAATRFGDNMTRDIARQFTVMSAGVVTDIDQIIGATQLIQDISEATGRSTDRITRSIAQLYGGNVEAINSLLPSQRTHINNLLVQEGATAAATAALRSLNDVYGGAARAIDETELKLAALTNGWGDFKEKLGGVLADLVIEQGAFDRLLSGLDGVIDWLDTNGDDLIRFFSNWGNVLQDIASDLGIIQDRSDSSTGVVATGLLTARSEIADLEAEVARTGGDPQFQVLGRDRGARVELQEAQAAQAARIEQALSLLPDQITDDLTPGQIRLTRILVEEFGLESDKLADAFESITRTTERQARGESSRGSTTTTQLTAAEIAEQAAARERARERERERAQTGRGIGEAMSGVGGALESAPVAAFGLFDMLDKFAPRLDDVIERVAFGLGGAFDEAAAAVEATQSIYDNFFDSLESSALSTGLVMAKALGGALAGKAIDVKSIFASMFTAVGAAATAAFAAGTAGIAAGGPLGPWLGIAIAASVFSGMLAGGGVNSATASASTGAKTTSTEDVFVGLRPEADRGGRAIFVQQVFPGGVFNTDDTRREVSRMRDEAILMGEARIRNG